LGYGFLAATGFFLVGSGFYSYYYSLDVYFFKVLFLVSTLIAYFEPFLGFGFYYSYYS
jgi:hypothetical protein